MLLVENVPQPVWLVDGGKADVREASLQLEASRRAQCRWIAAALSRWTELVFQL
jgi:hypothetical protein